MRARDPELARRRRCPDCFLHRSLCLCALIPRVVTRTRVVLVMHQLELNKPTNTGRLAVRCLPNSLVIVRGREAEARTAALPAGGTPLLLFPHADAQPLERWRDSAEPVTLVVPDGTWRQATRARRRVAGLDQIPCVTLPGGLSGYRLRQATRPGRLSTLEAITRALGILEGPEVEAPLAHIHQVMVDRTLWSNGRLSAEAVTGGVPPGVQSHDPLSGWRPPGSSGHFSR
jgi:DTW domain-containing protein YfiP